MFGHESTMAVNFLYGRPGLEPSHSSIGFSKVGNGAGNITNGNIIYYDDEVLYDQQQQQNNDINAKDSKYMYINGNNLNNKNNKINNNNSLIGLIESNQQGWFYF